MWTRLLNKMLEKQDKKRGNEPIRKEKKKWINQKATMLKRKSLDVVESYKMKKKQELTKDPLTSAATPDKVELEKV